MALRRYTSPGADPASHPPLAPVWPFRRGAPQRLCHRRHALFPYGHGHFHQRFLFALCGLRERGRIEQCFALRPPPPLALRRAGLDRLAPSPPPFFDAGYREWPRCRLLFADGPALLPLCHPPAGQPRLCTLLFRRRTRRCGVAGESGARPPIGSRLRAVVSPPCALRTDRGPLPRARADLSAPVLRPAPRTGPRRPDGLHWLGRTGASPPR